MRLSLSLRLWWIASANPPYSINPLGHWLASSGSTSRYSKLTEALSVVFKHFSSLTKDHTAYFKSTSGLTNDHRADFKHLSGYTDDHRADFKGASGYTKRLPTYTGQSACVYVAVGWANGSIVNPDAGRGLQPRPKRLVASIMFETLNVRTGLQTPSRFGARIHRV